MVQNTKIRTALVSILTVFLGILPKTAPVHAQDAGFLEEFAETEEISIAEAVYLLDILAGTVSPYTAFEESDYSAEFLSPIRVDDFTALLAQTAGISRSIMADRTGLPRYTLRDLRDARVLPPEPRRFPAAAPLAGDDALRMIRRALQSETSRVDPIRFRQPRRAPYFEWDLLVESAGESDLDGDLSISSRSVAAISVILNTQTQFSIDIGIDLGDDAQEFVLPEATLVRYFDSPNGASGAAGSVVLGRQAVVDLSTRLYDAPLDAVSLSLYRGVLAGEMLFGYTGAIPVAELNTTYTVDDVVNVRDRLLGPGDRAAPRYIGNLGVLFPELLGRQTPFAQITAQIDEETIIGDTEADRFDALYGTIGLKGSLSRTQFYEAYSILSLNRYEAGRIGVESRNGVGWLVGASWRWYPDNSLRSRVRVEALLASGDDDRESPLGFSDEDDLFRGFIPAAGTMPWTAYDGLLTNLALLRGSWSVRPVEALLFEVSLAGLMRMTAGATGSDLIDPVSSNRPLGIESGARIGIRPARDLILDINSSIFWPIPVDSGGAYNPERDPTGVVALEATIQL